MSIVMFVEESTEDPDSDITSDSLRDNPSPANSIPAIPQQHLSNASSLPGEMPAYDKNRPSVAQLAESSPDEPPTIPSISYSPKPLSGPSPLPSVSTWADFQPSLSSLSPRQSSMSSMTTREASLLRSFIQNLSPRVFSANLLHQNPLTS